MSSVGAEQNIYAIGKMMFRSNTSELENTTIGIKEGVCLPTHCAGNDTRKTCCVHKAKN